MESIGQIRIINPISVAPIKEYVKEFLRFIGCMVFDCLVEESTDYGWKKALQPSNEKNGVDIIMNYDGGDYFSEECRIKSIKRIFLNISVKDRAYCFSYRDDRHAEPICKYAESRKQLRQSVVSLIIDSIWAEMPDGHEAVSTIFASYTCNSQGDVFYLIQAKKGLRVLNMGEVLQVPEARVASLSLQPYLNRVLSGLWEIAVNLEKETNTYCVYTRLNTLFLMREVACRINEEERGALSEINYNGRRFRIIPIEELCAQLQEFIEKNTRFISAYLLIANISQLFPRGESLEIACYSMVRNLLSGYGSGHGFIWYKIGLYYEKTRYNLDAAKKSFQRAYQIDKRCYPALFKLGFYAAKENKFTEAESLLNNMINNIFAEKSIEPNTSGKFRAWENLSLKEIQYIFKASIFLAKIGINSERELFAKGSIGNACLSATNYEYAALTREISDESDEDWINYIQYHKNSTPMWAMWRVLLPWSENIIRDDFVKNIVIGRLQ